MVLLDSFFASGGLFFRICGWIASISLILGYVPQAWLTIHTRNTDGISLPGFIAMAIGSFGFLSQGLMLGLWDDGHPGPGFFIFVTNSITAVCSIIIFAIKMHNDYFKGK